LQISFSANIPHLPGKSRPSAEEKRKMPEKGPLPLLFLKERFHFPLNGVYYVIASFSLKFGVTIL
jgi:hypothetical protein